MSYDQPIQDPLVTINDQERQTKNPISHRARTGKRLRIGAYNTKGLRKSFDEILNMYASLDILFLSETWIRDEDEDLKEMVDECAHTPGQVKGKRGFGGVALIISPILDYEVVAIWETRTIQAITIRVSGISITGMYLSPAATAVEEKEVLEGITKASRGKAIIIGDLNARSVRWDEKSNRRGRDLVKWAAKFNWKIKAPSEPTFSVRSVGVSVIDIALVKGLQTSEVTTVPTNTYKGSDHSPIYLTVRVSEKRGKERGRIPKTARALAHIVEEARAIIENNASKLVEDISQCKDITQLEQCYDNFCKRILKPWENSRVSYPDRFRMGWSTRLDHKSRLRRKYYRLAKVKNDANAWQEYVRMDKEIKTEVKKRKERRKRSLANELSIAKPTEVSKLTKKLFADVNGKESTNKRKALRPDCFTRYVSAGAGEGFKVQQTPFKANENFQKYIVNAIKKAPVRKAVGPDELFNEVLKAAPEDISRILGALWNKCGELQKTISQWSTASLMPVYKKGERKNPESYRPIALLSHGRKIIDAAIAAMINESYSNNANQLGFQRMVGTESALLRHIKHANALPYTAVLDLKSAYDRVRRDILMEEVTKRVPQDVTAMVSAMLNPMIIQTVSDATGHTGLVTRGVPQGSPLSPTLFNLFMDEYIDQVEKNTNAKNIGKDKWEATLFADDIKLMAANAKILQGLLDVSGDWAKQVGMVWSTKKSSVLGPRTTEQTQFKLNGEVVQWVPRATYLGADINNQGVLAGGSIERVRKGRRKIHLLRTLGLHAGTLPAGTLLNICESFVLSTATYGIHLTPIDAELRDEWLRLEKEIVILATGCFTPARRDRLRDVTKLLSLQETKGLRWNGMVKRLAKRSADRKDDEKARADCVSLKIVDEKLGNQKRWTREQVKERRSRDDKRRQRRLPATDKRRDMPCMTVQSLPLKRAMFAWYCGLFPTHEKAPSTGNPATRRHAMLSLHTLMRATTWNVAEREEVRKSILALRQT